MFRQKRRTSSQICEIAFVEMRPFCIFKTDFYLVFCVKEKCVLPSSVITYFSVFSCLYFKGVIPHNLRKVFEKCGMLEKERRMEICSIDVVVVARSRFAASIFIFIIYSEGVIPYSFLNKREK